MDEFMRFVRYFVHRFRRELLAFTPLVLALVIRSSSSGPLSGEAAVLWIMIALLYTAGIIYLARRFPGLGLFGMKPRTQQQEIGLLRDADYSVAFGTDEFGNEVVLSPYSKAGLLISGVPGCGKTVALKTLLAGWRSAGAYVRIVDFKDSGDFDIFDEPNAPVIGDDIEACVDLLKQIESNMMQRAQWLKDTPGVKNFWERDPNTRPRLLVIAIDECQEAFETVGVDKARKELALEAIRLVKTLVKRGRSLGIFVVLSTQKADSTAIPTAIRDQIGLRLSGEQKTPEAAKAALGDLREDEPSPHSDIQPGTPGRMIFAGSTPVAFLLQAYRPTDEYLRHICRR